MAMTTMDKGLTASPGIHIPISSAWERKSRNLVALSATGIASRFLDASGKRTALF
jgi:hypothetical protein